MFFERERQSKFRATILRAARACCTHTCSVLILAHISSAGAAQNREQLQAADKVLKSLSRNEFRRLADMICRADKLSYSPYATNLPRLFTISFTAKQVATFGASSKRYVWGTYDGTGAPIRLTPREYHRKFVYDVDYRNLSIGKSLELKSVNELSELRALRASYPDAAILSYRYNGSEDVGYKDARELYLVFLRSRGGWCLKGIAHSEDTV